MAGERSSRAGSSWRQRVLLVAALALVLTGAVPVLARDRVSQDDVALAERFAPVFYFHRAEIFRPQSTDVIIEQARLRQSRRLWFDVNVLLSLDVPDLLDLDSDERHFLDVWYGDGGSSAYTNYSAHRAYYETVLSPGAGGPPVSVYAHVERDEEPGHITIQYWALYFYNDWFNKHEGDWEMVQVMLTAAGEPEWVVLSQHHGGTRRAWRDAPVEDGTHPVAYVALGSHANYFVGDETYPNGRDVGSARIEIMDRTGSLDRVTPDVILLPDRDELIHDPAGWPGAEWLPFRGHWGELAVQGDFGGPLGPADKGQQWERPYEWGMEQPLDVDAWYAHRLQVKVEGAEPGEARVLLSDANGAVLLRAETLDALTILHADPPATGVVALVTAAPGSHRDVWATWPDAAAGEVVRLRFDGVPFGASGQATLELGPGGTARLVVGGGDPLEPSAVERFEATWDAPDLVWIGGVLPIHQVGLGVLIALLSSVIPTLAYVGMLYWVDRYEKEPKRLLAAAFIWGAIPAVAVAAVAELFFQLPPDLIGPGALEAIRLGLVAPLLQEALKGIAVLFIAWRYRSEFDGVLDGVIYGAMVGFGFAMTGNLISYLSSFALWGFEAFSASVFADGLVRAANQAFYTAFLGAGLGFARLAQQRWQRWAVPLGGFGLAVVVHAAHSLLARNVLGLNVATLALTLAGLILTGVIVAWSLVRQRLVLRAELVGEVPAEVYRTVTELDRRAVAQWRALRTGGIGAWRRARKLHQLSAELAFKKAQARRRPEEPGVTDEVDRLREALRAVLELH
jgi:RsiW-degrading membrane proteinase PrsW (M82 family)